MINKTRGPPSGQRKRGREERVEGGSQRRAEEPEKERKREKPVCIVLKTEDDVQSPPMYFALSCILFLYLCFGLSFGF